MGEDLRVEEEKGAEGDWLVRARRRVRVHEEEKARERERLTTPTVVAIADAVEVPYCVRKGRAIESILARPQLRLGRT